MRFKFVTVGWQCAPWIEQTLGSVEGQTIEDWDVAITYDASTDEGADVIRRWCAPRDGRWQYQLNDTQLFAPRNQYEAIQRLKLEDDDVVVFLDLDGDRLAHPNVLMRLKTVYERQHVGLTYGSYVPVPPVGPPGPVRRYPEDVEEDNTYRAHTLRHGCLFNHLRTISGRVAKAIPESQFRWAAGPKCGQWYDGGTDYLVMMSALELSGGRYAVLPDTLLLYNHANPLADNLAHPEESSRCIGDILRRNPLAPLL